MREEIKNDPDWSCWHDAEYGCKPLTWAQRMKIAQGASRGLRYLHEAGIIHGDVRAKNIVLTHDLEPLVLF